MEAFVQLACPACGKAWEASPSALPALETSFDCPDCGERRRLSEYARSHTDLEVIHDMTT